MDCITVWMQATQSQIISQTEQRMSIPELFEPNNRSRSLFLNKQKAFDQMTIKKIYSNIRPVIYQAYAYYKVCIQR